MTDAERSSQALPRSIRLFHWLSAFLILVLLVLGTVMVRLQDVGLRFDLYQQHKTGGAIVLLMTILRLLNRLRVPAAAGRAPNWQTRVAAWVHAGIYVLLISIALAGWVMVSASPLPLPISLFGLADLPSIASPDLAVYTRAKALHGLLTKVLMIVLVVHVAAALKHHFVDRDVVLRRMWRG